MKIEAQKARAVQPNAPAFPPPFSVPTNENGTFRVVGIPPGTYEINAMGREVTSPKIVTIHVANSSIEIDVKPQSRPGVLGNAPPELEPPH